MPLHPRQEPVRAAILYSLEHYCHDDAVFLAERLYDEVGDVDSLYLLATCQYRSGRLQQARHLLSKLSPSCHAPSCLLYATICLDLDDPNGAVLALLSFLCFKECSETDIAGYYSSDAAIAFWLLGRSHRLLHNTREATRHFRSCLKFNPFLWSAFEALSCMGEAVSPEECFTVSGYPSFLPSLTECSHGHLSHPPPLHPHIPTTSVTPTAETRRSENCVPMVEEKQVPLVKKPSAFTPVDTNRASYVTPDLFAEPVVGKAIASSTPAPRALAFTRSDSGNEVGMANRVGVASSGGGCVDVGSVRMVLDFGSAPKSSGVESSEGHGTPMFGTLPPPPQGTCTPAVGTPSQSSPSPAPAHFTRQLLTAPVAPKKRVSHSIPPPAFKFSPTPEVPTCKSDATKLTNQICPSWSSDTFITPPQLPPESSPSVVTADTKPHPSKLPLKSALRRSERLRKTSLVVSQRKVGISNLVHSNNASKFRFKTSMRDGERSPRKGSRLVSGTPLSSRGLSSPRKSMTSLKAVPSSGKGGGEWEGGSGEGVAVCSEAVRLAEQQALANIGALMKLLQQAGVAYQCLHGYDLVTSLRCFRSLPPRHRSSAWCLSHMARAYHAGERYREAAKLFREVHSMDPHRQDGMELFASCLWHLRCDVELSVIMETLLTSDPCRVEGLCAKATSLNLARDHEGAVKCLQKAITVSPRFPYAHTLLGHEYVILKDFEKAMSSFQTAVSLDSRHYNAWYGMAHVCFSQERYRFAEVYVRKALAVNKCSAICCTQLALIQFRQKCYVAALRLLDKAAGLCHTNPIPRFHKAKVLESLGRSEEALQQLEELSHGWPKEPNIYISKGKVFPTRMLCWYTQEYKALPDHCPDHKNAQMPANTATNKSHLFPYFPEELLKKLKRPHEAVLNFSWALDFSHHGGNSHIREEVDDMYQVGEGEGRNGEEFFIAHSDGEEELEQQQYAYEGEED